MYVGIGVMLLCSVGIGVAFALNTDEEKPVTPTTTTTNDEDDEEEEEEENILATYVPEDFSGKTVEYKYKGPHRLLAGKTGWSYSQTNLGESKADAFEKCKKICDDRPGCPGFSLEHHRTADRMNCMYYRENTTGGVASEECITDPGSKPTCRTGINRNEILNIGGLYWRGK